MYTRKYLNNRCPWSSCSNTYDAQRVVVCLIYETQMEQTETRRGGLVVRTRTGPSFFAFSRLTVDNKKNDTYKIQEKNRTGGRSGEKRTVDIIRMHAYCS